MHDECLICGAKLQYLENDIEMECALCHKKENSKTACEKGHYVCNQCHTGGMIPLSLFVLPKPQRTRFRFYKS